MHGIGRRAEPIRCASAEIHDGIGDINRVYAGSLSKHTCLYAGYGIDSVCTADGFGHDDDVPAHAYGGAQDRITGLFGELDLGSRGVLHLDITDEHVRTGRLGRIPQLYIHAGVGQCGVEPFVSGKRSRKRFGRGGNAHDAFVSAEFARYQGNHILGQGERERIGRGDFRIRRIAAAQAFFYIFERHFAVVTDCRGERDDVFTQRVVIEPRNFKRNVALAVFGHDCHFIETDIARSRSIAVIIEAEQITERSAV